MALGLGQGSLLFTFFQKSLFVMNRKFNADTGQFVEEDLPGSGFETSVGGVATNAATTLATVPANFNAVVTALRLDVNAANADATLTIGGGAATPITLLAAGDRTYEAQGSLDGPVLVAGPGAIQIVSANAGDTITGTMTYKLVRSVPA